MEEEKKSFVEKVIDYSDARQKWIKAGKPLRSKKDILHIYENICKNCPHFHQGSTGVNSCKICGCRLSTDRTSFNKIAMESEHCPLEKWPGDEEAEEPASLHEKRNPPENGGGCGCGAKP